MTNNISELATKDVCYHCGLPAEEEFSASINHTKQNFCCIGCQLVAQAIVSGGLEQFYQYRDETNSKAESQAVNFSAYDLPDVQNEFVDNLANEYRRASISIANIACAACAWLIENYLSQLQGVQLVSVNVALHRCTIEWQPEQLSLSEIFTALHRIGYQAYPYTQSLANDIRKKEERNALLRLGVAGIGMMQVGMVAIALHAGAIQGMEFHWQHYLRWVSLIFATPVILYSAKPFFYSAWRALTLRYLNMDVSVSLALLLAYGASLWATISQRGDVYFDSVSMFTFFLLAGRFLEMRVRHSSAFATEKLTQLLPLTVERVQSTERQTIPLKALQQDDIVWIAAGDVIPCDAVVVEGNSSVDEAIVSGESLPQAKHCGDEVIAGSVNIEAALTIKVLRLGRQTKLAQVEALVEKAALLKPKTVALADRYSSYFVASVIFIALVVSIIWSFVAPEKAFWITLSVLVVTCPCALSLATPTALTAGILRLRQLGILVSSNEFIEEIAQINHILFDKTGTLTEGKLVVIDTYILDSSLNQQSVLEITAALEQSSRHPIAQAFEKIATPLRAVNVQVHAAGGVEGEIEQVKYRFGKREFACDVTVANKAKNGKIESNNGVASETYAVNPGALNYPSSGAWQMLTRNGIPVAWVLLQDKPRPDVSQLLNRLRRLSLSYELVSGDRLVNVEKFAREFNDNPFQGFHADVSPAEKLDHINARQARGDNVLMVGDGINDAPVLRGANVSLAMARSARLAQTHADAVMVNENLLSIPQAIEFARRVNVTVRQNLFWALAYNAIALPAAAMGWVPPYLAAIGMSASSLVVVFNAWRLRLAKF